MPVGHVAVQRGENVVRGFDAVDSDRTLCSWNLARAFRILYGYETEKTRSPK